MKYAIAMLLVGCWFALPVGAEIITMDTTIDSPHSGRTVQIFDGPEFPTTVEVLDGAVIQSSIVVNGHSALNIRGGRTHSFIFGRDHSTVNIFDGLVATDEDVEMEDNSIANIYGGHFGDDIEASDSATVNLYGGTFEKGGGGGATLSVQGDGVLHVYLREYEIVVDGQGRDRVIGVLLDGSEIDRVSLRVDPFELRSAKIILHSIPELDSLTLTIVAIICVGSCALVRRHVCVRGT